MLNASRHHRKNRLGDEWLTQQMQDVLNASRHHRKNRSLTESNAGITEACSTPRGITGKIALPLRGFSLRVRGVLNASRHHRKNRLLGSLAAAQSTSAQRLAASPEKSLSPTTITILSLMCSTPRGITGKIAGEVDPRAIKHIRAQRLAASPEKSHFTPGVEFDFLLVLNASRHHRKNRIARQIIFVVAVKVLNASRHHRKNRTSECDRVQRQDGAQRLAASPEKSRAGRGDGAEKACVLNASRHHRKNRKEARFRRDVNHVCSTPRGITGKIARYAHQSPARSGVVLNASRHHRKNRGAPPSSRMCPSTCSTPRGITGKIAHVPAPVHDRAFRVLNASRHHRKNRPHGPPTHCISM